MDELFELLVELPWWGTPIVAAVLYVLLAWVVSPMLLNMSSGQGVNAMPFQVFGNLSAKAAPWVGLGVLLLGVPAAFKRWDNRKLLDVQKGTESIRQLSWSEFERLLGEAFRREGYQVEHLGNNGPDGGVDLRLRKGSSVELVQCKHWKSRKVGVRVVRELLGVVTSQFANGGMVVTSGSFTPDAENFARKSCIKLIDGPKLLELLREVQQQPRITSTTPVPIPSSTPACPTCGGSMVLRTARQGANAGKQFWGCSSYPRCRGIENIG